MSCFVSVHIVRTKDRFKLCSTVDSAFQQAKGELANGICRTQVDVILQRMKAEDGFQSFDHREVVYYVLSDAAAISVVVVANKQALAFQQLPPSAMQSASCSLLEEIAREFCAMHPAEMVHAARKPYSFIKFDNQIVKLMLRATKALSGGAAPGGRKDATAEPQSAAYDQLKSELRDVHHVIKSSLDDILTRGERLETMNQYSSQLKDSSHGYYKRTVQMNRARMLKLYGPPALVLLVVALWLWLWYF
jgi:vesicle transport protein SEC22